MNTCNHGEWEDGEDRWSMNFRTREYSEARTSNSLLLVYEDVHEKARNGCKEEPISVSRFEEVLSP